MTITFGGRVLLVFESYDLQPGYSCEYDWLEVHDGNSSESELIGFKLCGNDIPRPLESSGNSLTLLFHSDSSGTFQGFRIATSQGM